MVLNSGPYPFNTTESAQISFGKTQQISFWKTRYAISAGTHSWKGDAHWSDCANTSIEKTRFAIEAGTQSRSRTSQAGTTRRMATFAIWGTITQAKFPQVHSNIFLTRVSLTRWAEIFEDDPSHKPQLVSLISPEDADWAMGFQHLPPQDQALALNIVASLYASKSFNLDLKVFWKCCKDCNNAIALLKETTEDNKHYGILGELCCMVNEGKDIVRDRREI